MASNLLSYVPLVGRLVASGDVQIIQLDPVEVHNVETDPDKRPRTLKHLLRANHVNYSIVYHNLQYNNHKTHNHSTTNQLGASVAQLHLIYDEVAASLEPW